MKYRNDMEKKDFKEFLINEAIERAFPLERLEDYIEYLWKLYSNDIIGLRECKWRFIKAGNVQKRIKRKDDQIADEIMRHYYEDK